MFGNLGSTSDNKIFMGGTDTSISSDIVPNTPKMEVIQIDATKGWWCHLTNKHTGKPSTITTKMDTFTFTTISLKQTDNCYIKSKAVYCIIAHSKLSSIKETTDISAIIFLLKENQM